VKKFDFDRGLRLARHAYRSRKVPAIRAADYEDFETREERVRTCKVPPITRPHYEDSETGEVITSREAPQ
jgi:hypothetical protein